MYFGGFISRNEQKEEQNQFCQEKEDEDDDRDSNHSECRIQNYIKRI